MADQGQHESTGTGITQTRDGASLDPTTATQNPLKKKMMDPSEDANQQGASGEQPAKQPVVRGDGTVLPERTEEQPRNPMKRMMDTGGQKEL